MNSLLDILFDPSFPDSRTERLVNMLVNVSALTHSDRNDTGQRDSVSSGGLSYRISLYHNVSVAMNMSFSEHIMAHMESLLSLPWSRVIV